MKNFENEIKFTCPQCGGQMAYILDTYICTSCQIDKTNDLIWAKKMKEEYDLEVNKK